MTISQVPEQPHTYIVENDWGRQLGTVDEFHTRNEPGTILYIARRFYGRAMFEEKRFPGFTAALNFVEKGYLGK